MVIHIYVYCICLTYKIRFEELSKLCHKTIFAKVGQILKSSNKTLKVYS